MLDQLSNACTVYFVAEALTKLDGKVGAEIVAAAKAKGMELLAPGAKVWEDGLLEEHEFEAVLQTCLSLDGISEELRKSALDHGKFAFSTEQQAAKADMNGMTTTSALTTQRS